MRAVLVDTGAWIALLNRREVLHASATAHYDRLRADGARLFATNYVVDETATRLRYDAGLASALAFRQTVLAAARARLLRIVWVDQRIEGQGWRLLEENPQLPLSLTDAISAAVARAHAIREVFGFDADFRALGFILAPET